MKFKIVLVSIVTVLSGSVFGAVELVEELNNWKIDVPVFSQSNAVVETVIVSVNGPKPCGYDNVRLQSITGSLFKVTEYVTQNLLTGEEVSTDTLCREKRPTGFRIPTSDIDLRRGTTFNLLVPKGYSVDVVYEIMR